jgi:hypothetical protein
MSGLKVVDADDNIDVEGYIKITEKFFLDLIHYLKTSDMIV